ncbi:MAG TPA: hypothetical protein VKI18_06670 [Albitalea sp.]|nr:hypothetical protein [Albitalea sp.]
MQKQDELIEGPARQAVQTFLAHPANATLVAHLERTLALSARAIEDAYIRYSLDSMSSGNDIYDDAGIHIAMWIEYQTAGSLHVRRQQVVLDELRRARPQRIADIGFGAPTRYLRDYVLAEPAVSAQLFDKYPAALEVGRSLMQFWGDPPSGKVGFALHDMDNDAPPPGFDCYLMLDAVEHSAHPDRYLAEAVAGAADGALFLFHMPIGPLIVSHTIAWSSRGDAVAWLRAGGLEVGRTEFIQPNPEVDHFARHGVALEDLFVVARKPA